MTTKEKIEVMKAYEDGKTIQAYDLEQNKWVNCHNPTWNWDTLDYRIKPEPTYRLYKDTAEMIEDFKKRFNAKVPPYAMPMIWVKYKDIKDCRLITGFMSKTVVLVDSAFGMFNLFDGFTYLDGSPCGMKEE